MPDDEKETKLNPNQATLEQLTSLPGVGESLGKRIQAGRPYHDEADLLLVSGVGDGLLRRISPMLTFESEAKPSPTQASAAESRAPAAKSTPSAKPIERRPSILLWCSLSAVAAVLVSVSLTLAILLSINGTLNMGRHERVQQLAGQLSAMQADLSEAQTRLDSTDQQLRALSGLSGRMSDVEDSLKQATTRMDDARQRVDDMQATVDELDAATGKLAERADRFDQFLNGLRDLLSADEATAGSSAIPEVSPTP